VIRANSGFAGFSGFSAPAEEPPEPPPASTVVAGAEAVVPPSSSPPPAKTTTREPRRRYKKVASTVSVPIVTKLVGLAQKTKTAVVILTDHTDFDYRRVVDKARALIDARHVAPRDGQSSGSGWIVKS